MKAHADMTEEERAAWLVELFEFANCEECMMDESMHVCVPGLFGEPRAYCSLALDEKIETAVAGNADLQVLASYASLGASEHSGNIADSKARVLAAVTRIADLIRENDDLRLERSTVDREVAELLNELEKVKKAMGL